MARSRRIAGVALVTVLLSSATADGREADDYPSAASSIGADFGVCCRLKRPADAISNLNRKVEPPLKRSIITAHPIDDALDWFARNQEDDGSWAIRKHGGTAPESWRVANTGLALLAIGGAGHSEKQGKHQGIARKAVSYLISKQNVDGQIGLNRQASSGGGYNHLIAGLALAEAHGLSNSPRTGKAAQRAADFTCDDFQGEAGGAGHRPNGTSNTHMTTWMVIQLKSAKVVGLRVPSSAWIGAFKYLDRALKPCGTYAVRPGQRTDETASVGGALSRMYMGWRRDDPPVAGAIRHSIEYLPDSDRPHVEYWYIGTLCMFYRGGDHWKTWDGAMRGMLTRAQDKTWEGWGSWDWPTDNGACRGRVWSTALSAMCLETYHRGWRPFF